MTNKRLLWPWAHLGIMAAGFGSIVLGCGLTKSEMDEEELCRAYAQRECDAIKDRCMPASTEFCAPTRAAKCHQFLAEVKGGERLFRPANIDACLKQVDETYKKALIKAEDFAALRAKCARVYEGGAKANDLCAGDQDCQSPLVCDKKHCGPLRTIAAGGNCANPGEICQSTEFCKPSDGLLVCSKRPAKDAPCSDTEPCAPGLLCQSVCVAKVANGMPCGSDAECAEGYCHLYPPTGTPRICAGGLGFAQFTPACDAYFAKPAGTP